MAYMNILSLSLTGIYYYSFHALGLICLIGYTVLIAPKFALSPIKALLFIVTTYVFSYVTMMLLFYIINGSFGGKNIIRIIVVFPLIILILSKLFRISSSKAQDMFSLAPCIVQGISRIGCIFPGCCYSNIEVSWGIYSKAAGKVLFPVQLLEAFVAIVIAVILILMLKKNKYDMQGRAMPIMLIMFGSTRFLLEFMRDNTKLFWGISELALWALGCVVIGVVWLIVFYVRKSKKQAKLSGETVV